jgi:hypothetical protein
MKRLHLNAGLFKVDEARRLVYGVATSEAPDHSLEIMDYGWSKPNFIKWQRTMQKMSQGKSQGNLREMHEPKAAGVIRSVSYDDKGKRIFVTAEVVDDQAWRKVMKGVYTGFSIGGSYGKKKRVGPYTRYEAIPTEISLADYPQNPESILELVKAAGVTMKVPVGTDLRKAKRGDKEGHPFRGNQHVQAGEYQGSEEERPDISDSGDDEEALAYAEEQAEADEFRSQLKGYSDRELEDEFSALQDEDPDAASLVEEEMNRRRDRFDSFDPSNFEPERTSDFSRLMLEGAEWYPSGQVSSYEDSSYLTHDNGGIYRLGDKEWQFTISPTSSSRGDMNPKQAEEDLLMFLDGQGVPDGVQIRDNSEAGYLTNDEGVEWTYPDGSRFFISILEKSMGRPSGLVKGEKPTPRRRRSTSRIYHERTLSLEKLFKAKRGEKEGHPFRGNQHVKAGQQGQEDDEVDFDDPDLVGDEVTGWDNPAGYDEETDEYLPQADADSFAEEMGGSSSGSYDPEEDWEISKEDILSELRSSQGNDTLTLREENGKVFVDDNGGLDAQEIGQLHFRDDSWTLKPSTSGENEFMFDEETSLKQKKDNSLSGNQWETPAGRKKRDRRAKIAQKAPKSITPKMLQEHPQYTREDYEYLHDKGWTNAEIYTRWNEEFKEGKTPTSVNKDKDPRFQYDWSAGMTIDDSGNVIPDTKTKKSVTSLDAFEHALMKAKRGEKEGHPFRGNQHVKAGQEGQGAFDNENDRRLSAQESEQARSEYQRRHTSRDMTDFPQGDETEWTLNEDTMRNLFGEYMNNHEVTEESFNDAADWAAGELGLPEGYEFPEEWSSWYDQEYGVFNGEDITEGVQEKLDDQQREGEDGWTSNHVGSDGEVHNLQISFTEATIDRGADPEGNDVYNVRFTPLIDDDERVIWADDDFPITEKGLAQAKQYAFERAKSMDWKKPKKKKRGPNRPKGPGISYSIYD